MRAAHLGEDGAFAEEITRRVSEIAIRSVAAELTRRGFRCIADDQVIGEMIRRLSQPTQASQDRLRDTTRPQTFVGAGVANVAQSVLKTAGSMTTSVVARIERKAAAQGIQLSAPQRDRLRSAVRSRAALYLLGELEGRLRTTSIARRAALGACPAIDIEESDRTDIADGSEASL